MLNVEHGHTIYDSAKSGEAGELVPNPSSEPLTLKIREGMTLRVRPREGRVTLIPDMSELEADNGILDRVMSKYLSKHTKHLARLGLRGCGHHLRVLSKPAHPDERRYFAPGDHPAHAPYGYAFEWSRAKMPAAHNEEGGKVETYVSNVSHIVCILRPEISMTRNPGFSKIANLVFPPIQKLVGEGMMFQLRAGGDMVGEKFSLDLCPTDGFTEWLFVSPDEVRQGKMNMITTGTKCSLCSNNLSAWCGAIDSVPICYACSSVYIHLAGAGGLVRLTMSWCPPVPDCEYTPFMVDGAKCWRSLSGNTVVLPSSLPPSLSVTNHKWWWDHSKLFTGAKNIIVTKVTATVQVP